MDDKTNLSWVAAPLPSDPELARTSSVYLKRGERVKWGLNGAGRVMGYEIIKAPGGKFGYQH